MVIAWLNPGAPGKHPAMQLLCVTDRLLVTRVGFIYVVDEFFFLFLVYLLLVQLRVPNQEDPRLNLWVANFLFVLLNLC